MWNLLTLTPIDLSKITRNGEYGASRNKQMFTLITGFIDRLLKDPLAYAWQVHDFDDPQLHRKARTERIRTLSQLKKLVHEINEWVWSLILKKR
jgi:hypothetical protein